MSIRIASITTPDLPPPDPRRAPHRPRTPHRRGVAMLLVLAALAVGTVLAGAMLTAEDSSPHIGKNACSAAAATWSAQAAAAYSEAILQTYKDWMTPSLDGTLLQNYPLAGGLVTVNITNAQGQPPTAMDRDLTLIATARVGAMTYTVERTVTTAPPMPLDAAVNVEMPEFALLAFNDMTIEDNAVITRLAVSPEAGTATPIKLGTGFTTSGNLDIRTNAKLNNVALFVDYDGSTTLRNVATQPRFAPGGALPFPFQVIPENLPSAMKVLTGGTKPDYTLKGNGVAGSAVAATLAAGGNYKKVRIEDAAVLTIDATKGDKYKFDELRLDKDAVLRISGSVAIHVVGEISLRGRSAIELADSSSRVIFFPGNDVTVDDSAIGFGRAVARNTARSSALITAYTYPSNIRFNSLSTVSSGKNAAVYKFDKRSMVLACIHNPNGTVELAPDCVLAGRATGASVKIRQRAQVLYDPRLDSRIGFSVLNGPIYKNGSIRPELATAWGTVNSTDDLATITTKLTNALKIAVAADPAWSTTCDPSLLGGAVATVGGVVSGLLGGILGGGTSVATPPPPLAQPNAGDPTPRSSAKAKGKRVPRGAREFED